MKKIAGLPEEKIDLIVDKIMKNISPNSKEEPEEQPTEETIEQTQEDKKEESEEKAEKQQKEEKIEEKPTELKSEQPKEPTKPEEKDTTKEAIGEDIFYSSDEFEKVVFRLAKEYVLGINDKDLIVDTGGEKYKKKEPRHFPPRYDLHVPENKNKEKDEDINNDPDTKKDEDFLPESEKRRMAKKIVAGVLSEYVKKKEEEYNKKQGTCPEGYKDTGDGCESPDGLWFPYE